MKSSFIKLIRAIVKLSLLVALFFLFGYFELLFRCGFVISLGLGLYIFRCGSKFKGPLVLLVNLIASYYEVKSVMLISWIILASMFFSMDLKQEDDTKVKLRPFEAEVRLLLFKTNPSVLHTVDRMLDEFKGREQELLNKIRAENSVKDGTAQSATPVSKSLETQTESIRHDNPDIGVSSILSQKSDSVNGNISVANENFNDRERIVKWIVAILTKYDRSMLASLDRMLSDYQGNELELLLELEQEYTVFDASYVSFKKSQQQHSSMLSSSTPLQCSFGSESSLIYRGNNSSSNSPKDDDSYGVSRSFNSGTNIYHNSNNSAAAVTPTVKSPNQPILATPSLLQCQSSSSSNSSIRSPEENLRRRQQQQQQRYHPSIVEQAKEDMRLAMEARINARFGPKPK